MKNLLKYSLLAMVVALVGSTAAHATGPDINCQQDQVQGQDGCQTPEVDPGMAIAGFTLLAGAVTVLRARRGK